MIKNDIINRIEDLKNYTDGSLITMQKSKVPSFYNLEVEQRYSYDEHGFYHSVYKGDSLLYLVKNLPFNINNSILKNHTFHGNMKNIVEEEKMFPFLLFLNNRFIKWSNITIIKDCKYSYIMIDNFDKRNPYPELKCILLPLNSKHTEDSINIENSIFAFNKYGELVDEIDNNGPYTLFDINYQNIFMEFGRVNTLRQKINLIPPKKIQKESLFVFNEGLLDTNITLKGLNVFSIDDRKPLNLANRIVYKVFYYNKGNESKDNINNVKNKGYLINKITSNEVLPSYIEELNKPFDFKYKQHDSYINNISNSLNYIMKYNSALMNEVYKSRSNIKTVLYKGKDIKKYIDKKGYIKLSRKIGDLVDNKVIIFVNGELYKNYSTITYINKDFKIPIGDIQDDDNIELLFFKNIDNRINSLVLHSGGNDIYQLDSSINLDNAKFFTIDIRDREFNIERKDSVQYEIDMQCERVDKTHAKLIPVNNFYYDRALSLVSERQFRYACKVMQKDDIEITLPYEFRYCNNPNKFLIFINSKKINNSNFKVTIVKPTRPFDDISVYVNIPVLKGQKLEVFYVPDELEETIILDNLHLSDQIIVDKSKIMYGLSRDLYMIFINGRKINKYQMYDINSTKLLISNSNSTKNICVIKHIKDDEILSKIFNDNEDMLTQIIDKIDSKQLSILYTSVIDDIEEPYDKDKIPMKDVMYRIIKKYWMRPYINNGTSFIYDFDDKFLEKDSDGNIIIREEDGNLEDKI